jgi:succinate dehydrogenase / fumarate reductase cytochrome b subunit
VRYTLQRITGIVAFLFLTWHVFHMHGWFHFENWVQMARSLQGSQFRPFNAASSVAMAMQKPVVAVVYAGGILACVFHLANGLWTMGITWGIWTSPGAQRRADWIVAAIGVAIATVGLSALTGTQTVSLEKALESEQRMVKAKLADEEITREQQEDKSWTAEEVDEIRQRVLRAEDPAAQTRATFPSSAAVLSR